MEKIFNRVKDIVEGRGGRVEINAMDENCLYLWLIDGDGNNTQLEIEPTGEFTFTFGFTSDDFNAKILLHIIRFLIDEDFYFNY